jgi:hypothetical protein
VIFNLFPQPTRLGHRSQIMEGPVLRPVSSYLIYKFTKSVRLSDTTILHFNSLAELA